MLKTGDCNRRIALTLRRTGSWENFPCLHRLEEGFGGISDDRRTDRYSGHSQQTQTRGSQTAPSPLELALRRPRRTITAKRRLWLLLLLLEWATLTSPLLSHLSAASSPLYSRAGRHQHQQQQQGSASGESYSMRRRTDAYRSNKRSPPPPYGCSYGVAIRTTLVVLSARLPDSVLTGLLWRRHYGKFA